MDLLAWISRQDAQAAVIGAGVLAASFAAIIALLRQPVINRPLRWFGRVVIADPLTKVVRQALDDWAHTTGGPVDKIDKRLASLEEQNVRNGGSTNRDRLNAIGRAVGADPDPVAHD
jgi:hypothetical protein